MGGTVCALARAVCADAVGAGAGGAAVVCGVNPALCAHAEALIVANVTQTTPAVMIRIVETPFTKRPRRFVAVLRGAASVAREPGRVEGVENSPLDDGRTRGDTCGTTTLIWWTARARRKHERQGAWEEVVLGAGRQGATGGRVER
jgi:hypothetical protein